MTHENEIPADSTVLETLEAGALSPSALIEALMERAGEEYDREDCRQAVQRCLNRGLIRLSDDLSLEVTPVRQDVAA